MQNILEITGEIFKMQIWITSFVVLNGICINRSNKTVILLKDAEKWKFFELWKPER